MSRATEEIAKEFSGAELGDPRRQERLLVLAQKMRSKPDSSFPKAMSPAELEGAYRFFGNPKVTPEAILAPHVRETLGRIQEEPVTLVVHDSSTLSFNSEGFREGLAAISEYKQQFVAHCSLAVRADGSRRPQGVLVASRHVPVGKRDGQFQNRWAQHIRDVTALGLSPETVVHVMDREADDYEVLDLLAQLRGRFVVRMQHNRKVLGASRIRDILADVRAEAERSVPLSKRFKPAGTKQRKVHPPRVERLAKLAFGSCHVALQRPSTATQAAAEQLDVNVVHVWETDCPSGETPIEWVLYTSEPIDTPEQLLQVVDWYRARWVIEEYFKALKTGCAIEERQLGDMHSLSNALALLLPIAWQLLLVRNEARERPDTPASEILLSDELVVLRAAARRPLPPNPTVYEAMLAIAGLGGHLSHNGYPGWQTSRSSCIPTGGWLFAPSGLVDGPLPAHYEPHESPLREPALRPASNPARQFTAAENPYHRREERTATRSSSRPTGSPSTTPRAGCRARLPYLAELQPELFCEVSPELAAERGLEHGGWATIVTARAAIEARVLVTDRIAPARGPRAGPAPGRACPYHWGWRGIARGDSANDLFRCCSTPTCTSRSEGGHVRHPARAPAAGGLPTLVAGRRRAETPADGASRDRATGRS